MIYVSAMATRIRKGARLHLYITEWRELRGWSVEELASRLDVARETVWRWENDQDRLNPSKMAALANALDIEPENLWHRPEQSKRPSIDAELLDAPDDLHKSVLDLARSLTRRAS